MPHSCGRLHKSSLAPRLYIRCRSGPPVPVPQDSSFARSPERERGAEGRPCACCYRSAVNCRRCKSKMNQVSDEPSNDPSKRVSGDAPAAAARAGCFDCNICLDSAAEPVVTLCGHLYCWPCIYEWLRRDAAAGTISTGRPCPVCKAALTLDSLVPLYGRGGSRSSKSRLHPAIPRRPTVHREAVEQRSAQTSGGSDRGHVSTEPDSPTRSSRHAHVGAAQFDILYPPRPLGRGMIAMHSTAGGVLGGMALALLPWVFGGQAPAPSYPLGELQNLSPRLRRQHMEVDRSLHQLLFFLFVFVVLCLLLF